MWKYDPKLIKEQKKITWIICIGASIFISTMLVISHFQNLETSSNKSLIISVAISFVIPIAYGFLATWSLNNKSQKAWNCIIKEFSLIENQNVEFNYTLKDCYRNRKTLGEIIDLLRVQPINKDFFSSLRGIETIKLGIFCADCTMTNLLMRLINSMGGKFYLYFSNEKKIFLCVVDSYQNEIYKKEVKDLSELREKINVKDYI